MVKDFIVATEPNGQKILIQVNNIFSISGNNDGTRISSVGGLENSVFVIEPLEIIVEKINGRVIIPDSGLHK